MPRRDAGRLAGQSGLSSGNQQAGAPHPHLAVIGWALAAQSGAGGWPCRREGQQTSPAFPSKRSPRPTRRPRESAKSAALVMIGFDPTFSLLSLFYSSISLLFLFVFFFSPGNWSSRPENTAPSYAKAQNPGNGAVGFWATGPASALDQIPSGYLALGPRPTPATHHRFPALVKPSQSTLAFHLYPSPWPTLAL